MMPLEKALKACYGYKHDLLKNVKHYANHYTFPRKLGN